MMPNKQSIFLISLALASVMAGSAMAKDDNFVFSFPEGITSCDPNALGSDRGSTPLDSTEVADATPCKIPITEVYVTQMSVGKVVAQCKMMKVEDDVKDILKDHSTEKKDKIQALNNYLWARGKDQRKVPLIVGLDGRFYITDHHHLSWAVWEYADRQRISDEDKEGIILQGVVTANWQDKASESLPTFWNVMEKAGKAWFYDENGQLMSDKNKEKKRGGFPKDLGKMKNDAFRSISRWEREACLYLKIGKDQCSSSTFAGPNGKVNQKMSDFMEFRWANYLRYVITTWKKSDQPSARDLRKPKKLTKIFRKLIPSMFDEPAVNAYFRSQPGWGDANEYGLNTSVEENYWKLTFCDEIADGDTVKCEISPDLKSNK